MTHVAARALGLADRGRLRVGMRADVAVYAIDEPAELAWRFGAQSLPRDAARRRSAFPGPLKLLRTCTAATRRSSIDVPHAGTHVPDAIASRLTAGRERAARTPTGTSTSSTRSRATRARRVMVGDALALRRRPQPRPGAASRSTRAPTTPSSCRRARSTTRRSGATARRRTPRDRGTRHGYFTPYHDALAAEIARVKRAARPCGAARRATRSARTCRVSSPAACPISTSAPPTARAPHARPRALWRPARSLASTAASRPSSTAASRAAGSRATTGARRRGRARAAARDRAEPRTWTRRRPGRGTRRAPRRSGPCCSGSWQRSCAWRPDAPREAAATRAGSRIDAWLLRDRLLHANIDAHVFNAAHAVDRRRRAARRGGAAGVGRRRGLRARAGDRSTAFRVERAARRARLRCAHCGEDNPATFELCWKCGGVALGPRQR